MCDSSEPEPLLSSSWWYSSRVHSGDNAPSSTVVVVGANLILTPFSPTLLGINSDYPGPRCVTLPKEYYFFFSYTCVHHYRTRILGPWRIAARKIDRVAFIMRRRSVSVSIQINYVRHMVVRYFVFFFVLLFREPFCASIQIVWRPAHRQRQMLRVRVRVHGSSFEIGIY